MAPFPHPAHRTGQADFPHPALGQDFTLSRATPSAASEHLLELIGFPISRSFTTYCVCLELRSLRSFHPDVSVFPDRVVGSTCALSFSRIARRSLALRPAHSRCHQFVTR